MDVDVELEVVVVFSKVGLVVGEANVERFELLTGPPLAKVSLKP